AALEPGQKIDILSVGAIAGSEDMPALPPGVREESHEYVAEDSASDSLFPPEPIKSASPFQSHEVAASAPVSIRDTIGAISTNTGGDGSDSTDIPF
ncbi:MAG TPA: hypothetical protein DEV81_17520, partial [Cyanobacteria bacterium UBA11049]|nr:hypothetical protein [Cyanobacteria bacterium UBA11049]